MSQGLFQQSIRPLLQKVKANRWLRSKLQQILQSHIASRKMADYPLEVAFPTAQHLNLFFSTRIRYEPHIARHFPDHLHEGGVCFDVGANIGLYTLIAAHCVGTTGQVHAFEPDPQNHQWLTLNAQRNHLAQVTIHKHAVGATPSTATLFQDTRTSRTSSLMETHQPNTSQHITRPQLTVEVLPLDHYTPQISRLDLLKIDVEGFEHQVLLGAQELLQTFSPYLVIEMGKERQEACSSLLEKLDYQRDTRFCTAVDFMQFFSKKA